MYPRKLDEKYAALVIKVFSRTCSWSSGGTLIGSKRAWQAGDVSRDAGPSRLQESKKAREEKENEFFLGGCASPTWPSKRCAWSGRLEPTSAGMEIAETYGGGNCAPDPEVVAEWTRTLEKLLRSSGCRDEGGV